MSKLSIVIDEREKGLYEAILPFADSLKTLSISKQVLSLGDIIIRRFDEDETTPLPLIIFERKTISDLLASIQDGRYKEQSTRLLHASSIEPHNIIYLIEGPIGSLPDTQRQKVYSAMSSILIGKHMSVLRTWTIQESAELIARMTDKLARESAKGNVEMGMGMPTAAAMALPTTLSSIRKNNITPNNIGEILLIQIPGISSVTAKAILDTYGNSFSRVLHAVDTNDPVLGAIQYQTTDGKTRRISKGIVAKLKELLGNKDVVSDK